MLKIRVSRPYDDLKEFCKKLADACDCCVIYEHEADASVSRTHIHAFVENPKVSTDTMKNWVKKALDVTAFPKADWAFTAAEDRGFITYLSKGQLDPKLFKGILRDEVSTLKTAWVPREEKPKKTQYILRVENPAQQKLRQHEMVVEVRRRLAVNPPHDEYHMTSEVIRHIQDVVVKENKTLCGRYKLRDYYDTIMMLEDKPMFQHDLEKFCRYKT